MSNLLDAALAAARTCLEMKFHGLLLNERYLHHFISHRLQEQIDGLDLMQATENLVVHPEWPTFKMGTEIACGRYRAVDGKYEPVADGTAGFIDFALGDYKTPEIGIEITLKSGWAREEIVYDFVKLLDGRNPFATVMSLNVILRPRGVAAGGRRELLHRRMLEAYDEAATRLGDWLCDKTRERYFIVLELALRNARRFWYFDPDREDFIDTEQLPPILFRSEE
jgi:hypothetical protein